jgi:hypothetical protein
LAAAIKKQLGLEADLVESSGGILEMRADGAIVYTNKGEAAERYPGDDEMVRKLQSYSSSDTRDGSDVISETTDGGSAPSCSIEPPPIVKPPAPERRTEIDRMSFACNCAPVTGPEGCTCHS